MRLLVIEDNTILGNGLQVGLTQHGYAVDWLQTAEEGDIALQTNPYEAMILDLSLPKQDGLSFLRQLRREHNDLPVLILTARDSVQDRVTGLDAGADDYLIKPFELDELSARIRALLRRRSGRAHPLIQHGALTLDPAAHTVSLNQETVNVSGREFAILLTLLENAGRVLSRAQLEESLYSWDALVESNAVEVHIHHLRKKLGKQLIRTIRGVGYMVDKAPAE